MQADEARAQQRREFEERVKSMTAEELLALASILKRKSRELSEELGIVTEHLEAQKRKADGGS